MRAPLWAATRSFLNAGVRRDGAEDVGQHATLIDIDLMPGAMDAAPDNLTDFGGELYFMAESVAAGRELYRIPSDSLIPILIDVNKETVSSFPSDFFVI